MIHRHFLIATTLLAFCFPVPSPADTVRAYTGKVGSQAAQFTLTWKNDGTVEGRYFCPDGKGITYELRGTNPKEGVLSLDEYTGKQITARLSLTKTTKDGKIMWSGTMHNTDGRKIPVSFARSGSAVVRKELNLEGAKDYLAVLNETRVQCKMRWNDDSSVEGLLVDPSDDSTITLRGHNQSEGILQLQLTDDGKVLGNVCMSKQINARGIIWSGGIVNSKDEHIGDLVLLRYSDGSVPKGKEELYQTVKVKFAEVTDWGVPRWQSKPLTRNKFFEILSSDGPDWGNSHQMNAKVLSSKLADGVLEVIFEPLTTYWDWDARVLEPETKKFTFRVANVTGHNPFTVGEKHFIVVRRDGTIGYIGLPSMAITHWRVRENGYVEVKGKVMKDERSDIRESTYIPDKVAMLDVPASELEESEMPYVWLSAYFHPSLGFLLHVDAAGPGELEIEAATTSSTPAKPQEIPWKSAWDEAGAASVPLRQRAYNGG